MLKGKQIKKEKQGVAVLQIKHDPRAGKNKSYNNINSCNSNDSSNSLYLALTRSQALTNVYIDTFNAGNEVGIITIPMLYMGKLRHKEVK